MRATLASSARMPQLPPYPQIPGERIDDREVSRELECRMCNVCGIRPGTFIPSLPASFTQKSFKSILNEDYWVCEKSDGIRVVVFLTKRPNTQEQELYLMDRKKTFFRIDMYASGDSSNQIGIFSDTVLDGELIFESNKDKINTTVLLLFDCLAIKNENVTRLPFQWRYACLQNQIRPSIHSFLEKRIHTNATLGFEFRIKRMMRAFQIRDVLQSMQQSPRCTDGLIFTCLSSRYSFGTNVKILKWKPSQSLTVDFLIRVRPEVYEGIGSKRRAEAANEKPVFELYARTNDDSHVYFDDMRLNDDEWARWMQFGNALDGRIVECAPFLVSSGTGISHTSWRPVRLRDDKIVANHQSVVTSTLESIHHGVSEEKLSDSAPSVAENWFNPNRWARRVQFEKNQSRVFSDLHLYS